MGFLHFRSLDSTPHCRAGVKQSNEVHPLQWGRWAAMLFAFTLVIAMAIGFRTFWSLLGKVITNFFFSG